MLTESVPINCYRLSHLRAQLVSLYLPLAQKSQVCLHKALQAAQDEVSLRVCKGG